MDLKVVPSWMILRDVFCEDKSSFLAGGLADIFCGMWNAKKVALKRLIIFSNWHKDDVDDAKKVSIIDPPTPKSHDIVLQRFYYESAIWATVKHINVLQVLGISEDVFRGYPCLVLPWMKNGSIPSFVANLKEAPRISQQTLRQEVVKWVIVQITQPQQVLTYRPCIIKVE